MPGNASERPPHLLLAVTGPSSTPGADLLIGCSPSLGPRLHRDQGDPSARFRRLRLAVLPLSGMPGREAFVYLGAVIILFFCLGLGW